MNKKPRVQIGAGNRKPPAPKRSKTPNIKASVPRRPNSRGKRWRDPSDPLERYFADFVTACSSFRNTLEKIIAHYEKKELEPETVDRFSRTKRAALNMVQTIDAKILGRKPENQDPNSSTD